MKLQTIILCLTIMPGCSYFRELKQFAFPSLVPDYGRFEASEYNQIEEKQREENLITIRLDGLKIRQALLALSDITGRAIVWAQDLDDKKCSGYFQNVPLLTVLDALSRRVGAEIMEVDGVYYIGELKVDDLATAVISLPPGNTEKFGEAIEKLLSDRGKVSAINASIVVRDTVEALRKIVRSVNRIRENSLRRYVCELWFISCKRSDLVHLGAKLEIKNIDLLTVNNARELFRLLLEAEAKFSGVQVLQRPVLQVSEGLQGSLSSGREIPLEQKAITDSGAIETTGYEIIQDGLQTTMTVHRVSEKLLNCNLRIEVSNFDNLTSDKRPIKDSKTISSNIILRDGEICLVGGIGRNDKSGGFELITLDLGKNRETVLVWLRVRELQACKPRRKPAKLPAAHAGGKPKSLLKQEKTSQKPRK